MTAEIIAHMRRPTVVIDCVQYVCSVFDIQTIKPFLVPEMIFKGHSRSSAMAQFNKPHITLYGIRTFPLDIFPRPDNSPPFLHGVGHAPPTTTTMRQSI